MARLSVPQFRVREVQLYERNVRLRMPFRFGVVTLREAPQCFVRARIEYPDSRTAWGAAAEVLAPKWFDKDLSLSNEQNFDQLRHSLRLATEAYTQDATLRTAFGHFAAHYDEQIRVGAHFNLNTLTSNFGPAEIDCAVLDALCRIEKCSFYEAISANLTGIAPDLLPQHLGDLATFDISRFLARLQPADSVAVRHTVGLADIIGGHPGQVGDGLPETLEEAALAYGLTYFKLKVGGDADADLHRLCEIASVLDRIEQPYIVSLDGNEQYDDLASLQALWRRMTEIPSLNRLVSSISFIEQPITRTRALESDVSALAAIKPVIIDESDDGLGAFLKAKACGYQGVSSKSCKGLYKSILNAARCALLNNEGGRYFMTGEDLTTQAGLAVQQDLALINIIGLTDVERNGHHYVNGMTDLSESEQVAFLAAHPDLYERSHGAVRLKIRGGRLQIGSLSGVGFATGAYPDWDVLTPLASR